MEANKLGHVSSMKLDLTSPMKMDYEMDIRALVLLCGKNGVGKTVIMKYNWVLNSIMHAIVALGHNQSPVLADTAQFFLDHSFDDHNTNGSIGCKFETGAELEIICENGKVTKVNVQRDPSITISSQPIYMSSETRLLSDIIRYLRFCRTHDMVCKVCVNEENLHKVLDLYKLYDIFFMEVLLAKLQNGLTEEQAQALQTKMQNFDEDFILKGMKITDKGDDIIMTSDGENWTSVRLLGAGHQALLTMQLGMLGLVPEGASS